MKKLPQSQSFIFQILLRLAVLPSGHANTAGLIVVAQISNTKRIAVHSALIGSMLVEASHDEDKLGDSVRNGFDRRMQKKVKPSQYIQKQQEGGRERILIEMKRKLKTLHP